MKAIVVHQGMADSEVLKFEQYPDPVAGPGEVLVRGSPATSVNPSTTNGVAGLTRDFYPMTFPGLIESTSRYGGEDWSGVEGFSPGDQVFRYGG